MGDKEPRERASWGRGGGWEGDAEAPAPRRDLGVPAPRLCPKREPSAWATRTSPRGPGGAVQAPPAVRGGWTEPRAEGAGSGAWSTHLSRPPRSSRRLGGPAAPARPSGGRARRKTAKPGCVCVCVGGEAPQRPGAAGTRAASSSPGDNGREGEKRVKKLG